MTHEETMTFHARELQSYKQLPQIWYHFATKDRDEPRPRGGLLRVREFIMKDAYSFDRDEEGLDRSFQAPRGRLQAHLRRAGIEVYEVEAESGMMGGSESTDYLAPAESGENTLVTCENGDYAADLEIARGIPRGPEFPERLDSPEEVETPGVTTIEALAELLANRSGRDVQGNARGRGRAGRARPPPRGRPARGGEAGGGARGGLPAGHGGGDPPGVRGRPGLARPGRVLR